MSDEPHPSAVPKGTPSADSAPSFDPVEYRTRKDGWTPQKQTSFIKTLAATGSVLQACRAVNMSRRAAYNLYNRQDAGILRAAWHAALDQGCQRIADALMSRAIDGVATPIFYKGEKIGERRTFDNRLGMWTLERRVPERYGAWRDGQIFRRQNPDGASGIYLHQVRALIRDVVADEVGRPRPGRPVAVLERHMDDPAELEAAEAKREHLAEFKRRAEMDAWLKRLDLIKRGEIDPTDPESFARWEAERARIAAARPPADERDQRSRGDNDADSGGDGA